MPMASTLYQNEVLRKTDIESSSGSQHTLACGKGTPAVFMLRLLPLEVLAIHSTPSWRGWPFVS